MDEDYKGYKMNDHFVFELDGAPTLNLKKHIEFLLQPYNGEPTPEI
jgi:hypothetical protein